MLGEGIWRRRFGMNILGRKRREKVKRKSEGKEERKGQEMEDEGK